MRIRTFLGILLSTCLVAGLLVSQYISSRHQVIDQLSQLVNADSLVMAELEQLEAGLRQYILTIDLVLSHGESYLVPSIGAQQELLTKGFDNVMPSPLIDDKSSVERITVGLKTLQRHVEEWSFAASSATDKLRELNALIAAVDPVAADLVREFDLITSTADAVARRAAEDLASLRDRVARETFAAGAGYGTIILFLWYWSTRYVSNPLVELSSAGKASLDRGAAFDARPSGPSEVAAVSRQLGCLIDDLQQQVEQRTQALTVQNRDLAAAKTTADEARRVAEQASRAKSEFMARMSHEIRTPINGVMGMAELLLISNIDQQQREYALTILDSSDSLMSIINDILDFSKIEADRLELNPCEFSVHEAISATAALLQNLAEVKGLELIWPKSPQDMLWVWGDKLRFRQILTNLVGNAVKFTIRGRVSIDVKSTDLGEGDILLRVEVSDTGIGIDSTNVRDIFDSFSQVDGSDARRFGGTGLGLPISKELVELMGGRIGVDSTVNEGSTFWIELRLPRLTAKRLASEHAEVTESALLSNSEIPLALSVRSLTPLASSPRVLLAEDNTANQKVAVTMLRILGCDVDLADDGRAAVQKATNRSYDIILMDCQMPHVDGIAATKAIRDWEKQREATESIPIVAVTANALLTDRERCLNAGMTDYLSKPFRLADLKATIERSLTSAELPSNKLANIAEANAELSHLEELAQLGASESELQDVVDCYIDSSRKSVRDIASAIEAHNLEAIKSLAHKLKGGSAQVGAYDVARLCSKLRDDAAGSCWRKLADQQQRIEEETMLAHARLKREYCSKDTQAQ